MSIWPTEAGLLRQRIAELEAECDQWQRKLTEDAWPEIERLRAKVEELQRVIALVSKAGRMDNEDNERLRHEHADMHSTCSALPTVCPREAEIERLRAALERYRAGEIECPICELWHQPGTCMEVHD